MADLALDLLPVAPLLTVWAADKAEFRAWLGRVEPPDAVSRARLTAEGAVLRLGPDEWLVVGAAGAEAAWQGVDAVDVTGAWVGMRVSGPSARGLLARGAAIDLDPRRFPAGHCARTRLARCPVILLPRGETVIDLLVARSYAPWLLDWLRDAGRGLGLA